MRFLIATAALASLTAPLAAAPVQFTIEYSDLNLASVEGQKILDRRIDRAARAACGYGNQSTGTRIRSREARECYRDLKAQAYKQFAARISGQAKGG